MHVLNVIWANICPTGGKYARCPLEQTPLQLYSVFAIQSCCRLASRKARALVENFRQQTRLALGLLILCNLASWLSRLPLRSRNYVCMPLACFFFFFFKKHEIKRNQNHALTRKQTWHMLHLMLPCALNKPFAASICAYFLPF